MLERLQIEKSIKLQKISDNKGIVRLAKDQVVHKRKADMHLVKLKNY